MWSVDLHEVDSSKVALCDEHYRNMALFKRETFYFLRLVETERDGGRDERGLDLKDERELGLRPIGIKIMMEGGLKWKGIKQLILFLICWIKEWVWWLESRNETVLKI